MAKQSALIRDARQWTFTDKRVDPPESRTYEQAELTIDGETQLFGLIARTVGHLKDIDFPFEQLGSVVREVPDPDKPDETMQVFDVPLAGALLGQVASAVPSFLSQAAAVMLGLFPYDDDGRRNTGYDDEVKFLRRSLHLADAAEMIQTFTEQNDIARLRAPFRMAMGTLSSLGTQSPSTSPSTKGSTSSSVPDTGGPGRLPDGSRTPPSTPR